MTVPKKRTSRTLEVAVLTHIAQGMKYTDITEETGVPVSTIKKIKKRNPVLLAEIRHRMVQQEAETAVRLLYKSRRLIEKQLDKALLGSEDISLRELLAISREMFKQSQIEPAMPVQTQSGYEMPERTAAMIQALHDEDHETLAALLFSKEKQKA